MEVDRGGGAGTLEGKCTERRKRKVWGRREERGRKWEKQENIVQHCILIFCNERVHRGRSQEKYGGNQS